MARLHGAINLSRIPKQLIKKNSKGESILWVDVNENLKPSDYGDTHTITCYDKENQRKIYLANLRPEEQKEAAPQAQAPANNELPDLPW
jgi:hypothetical protein